MKIILRNINYKGYHFDRWETELPKRNENEPLGRKITEYITDSLDKFIKEKES